MKNRSRRMALCGVMTALAVAIMLLGGIIPLATFCCPAMAALMLIPLMVECGKRMALGAYAAISMLSLILCADKEAALLFAFLGYYPVIKQRLDAMPRKWLRRMVKFMIWNVALGAMYALIFFLLKLDQVMADYQTLNHITLVLLALLGNFTLILYDRLMTIGTVLYIKKYRPRLFGHHE